MSELDGSATVVNMGDRSGPKNRWRGMLKRSLDLREILMVRGKERGWKMVYIGK